MIGNNWDNLLHLEYNKYYFKNLMEILSQEEKKYKIYPKRDEIFQAFKFTDYDKIKCVIIGQDPYYGAGQANGLAFAVNRGVKIPPSLQNIYKELNSDLSIPIPNHGDLSNWAKNGVFLLNSTLTVRENQANSHRNIGWQRFTDEVIRLINLKNENVVFILWGRFAQSKQSLITNKKHLILTGAHPSPLSCYNGFFGKKYFSKTNDFLEKNGIKPINWIL